MAKTLSAIRAIIRQLLRDEFSSSKEFEWKDDELDIYIADCLTEISERRPYEVKDTSLKTAAGSFELDISSIDDLIKVEKVEFPVGKEPPAYRNASVFGDTLRFDYDYSPAGGQAIYIYCWKYHQLTESTNTLNQQLERVLVRGVCARAAIAKSRSLINKVTVGGAGAARELQTWGVTKLAMYERDLKLITKQRRFQYYPTS